MTNQPSYTHLSRAADLNGLSGVYEYQPDDQVTEITKRFKEKMESDYNVNVWRPIIESIIKIIGLEDVTPDGRFATRFIREWKKRNKTDNDSYPYYPFKPVTEAGAVVGDIYKQVMNRKPARLYWRITTDIRGILENPYRSDGYGNPNSCWFSGGQWGRSPEILEQANGAALLLGTADPVAWKNGVGRCFLVDGEDGLILFNHYLDLGDGVNRDKSDIAEFFADIMLRAVLKYKPLDGENPDGYFISPETGVAVRSLAVYFDHTDSIYINDGAHILTEEQDPETGEPFEDYIYYNCEHCGAPIDEDEAYTTPDGRIYCEYCFGERYTTCDNCGEPIPSDEIITDGLGYQYCESCYENNHRFCDNCGEEICTDHENTFDDNGDILCESCHEEIEAQRDREAQRDQEEQPEP